MSLFYLKHVAKAIFHEIQEYVFPQFCISCGREGKLVCDKCTDLLVPVPICRQIEKDIKLYSFFEYTEGSLVSQLIESGKYHYIEDAFYVFSSYFERHIDASSFSHIDMIVPVPLHRKRYAMRGFNQSVVIAEMLSQILQVPIISVLKRTKETKQQASLSKVEREENTKNAFSLRKDVTGASILLVDDVYTTGSTIKGCIEALEEGDEIICLTIAYGK